MIRLVYMLDQKSKTICEPLFDLCIKWWTPPKTPKCKKKKKKVHSKPLIIRHKEEKQVSKKVSIERCLDLFGWLIAYASEWWW